MTNPDLASSSQGYLLQGDCLPWLHRIAEGKKPRFDLVYIDPPFNAGGARGLRHGSGTRATGRVAYRDQWGGIERFLEMLRPRLAAVRDVMAPCSSLWLHLDHRAVHETKVIADEVFGRSRFEGEIVWVPGNGARRRGGPSVTHQTILIYSREGTMVWNVDEPCLREPYASTSRKMHFRHVDPTGRRYRERSINGKLYRYYEDEGRLLGSVWSDCGAMRANTPLVSETTGYPTQKPEKLLDRIIRAACHPGGWVLDPMCGSGTTMAVAANLGRRYCGIDESAEAITISGARLQKLGQYSLAAFPQPAPA